MHDKIDYKFHVKNLMSDEAHVYQTNTVNKQNYHYWAVSSYNPHIIHEKLLHNPMRLYELVLQCGVVV